MNILRYAHDVSQTIEYHKNRGKKIGFVPTMGALHQGHISLLKQAKTDGCFTVMSIFVNPKQFNDKKDLDLYPRTLDADIAMLTDIDNDLLYCPDEQDIYGQDYRDEIITLGKIEHLLEGKMRPGHFLGVAKVVKRLFEIVGPDVAYFGQKDFQQTVIIKKLVELYHFKTHIEVCPIMRESNGLAMSSRNERLSESSRKQAGFIYQTLQTLKQDVQHMPLSAAKQKAIDSLNAHAGSITEYLEIVNGNTLETLDYLSPALHPVALTVVKIDNVRLLDNIYL